MTAVPAPPPAKVPFVWRGTWDEFDAQVRERLEGTPVIAHIGHPEPPAPAPEAATPVEALAAELNRLAGNKDGSAVSALDENRAAWYRGCAGALRNSAGRVRELAPAWTALAAERDAAAGRERMATMALAEEIAEIRAERDQLRDQLTKALGANQRWAETLGDIQQAGRERDELQALIDAGQPTLASEVLRLREQLDAERSQAAALAEGLGKMTAERDAARELIAEIIREVAEWTIVGEDLARISEWRQRAGLEAPGA